MAKFTVKLDTKPLIATLKRVKSEVARKPSPQTLRLMGSFAVEKIRDLTSKGLSPISTGTKPGASPRYSEYRGGYAKRIREGKLGGKRLRPVNLRLTGEMLRNLKYVAKPTGNIEIGYYDTKSAVKEDGHQKGHNNQAIRPTIPGPGQTFSQSIIVNLSKILAAAMEKRLEQLKKAGK